MIFLQDHLLATLIGATVFMLLVISQMRVQEAKYEAAAVHSAKNLSLEFATWIEDDITTLGLNFGENRERFEMPKDSVVGTDTLTARFVFYKDSVNTLTDDTLRYYTGLQLKPTQTVTRSGQTIRLYEVRRATRRALVKNKVPQTPTAWVHDGKSPPSLTSFRLQLLQETGQRATTVTATDYIRASFSMLPPQWDARRFGGNAFTNELQWQTTMAIRPY